MERPPSDRTGVLVVRLWIEEDHLQGLHARITHTLDTATNEQSAAVAASADRICAVVTRWVEDFSESRLGDGATRPRE